MSVLDVRTILILQIHDEVLLLKRAAGKALFPNLITGIGGKVELQQGEDQNIEAAALRELTEETHIHSSDIENLRTKLITIIHEDDKTRLLYWISGTLKVRPTDLYCNEGELAWYQKDALPAALMVPTAKESIKFVIGLKKDDSHVYTGTYQRLGNEYTLIVNQGVEK